MSYEIAREAALAAILPANTDRYIALFLGDPIGVGAELTLTGYARVAFQDWSTSSTPTISTRSPASAIVFPTVTQAGTADHWAIFDAPVGGNLWRSGRLLDNLGQPLTIVFTGGGDEARFDIGTLRLKAQ
jgi:hypothetical protein